MTAPRTWTVAMRGAASSAVCKVFENLGIGALLVHLKKKNVPTYTYLRLDLYVLAHGISKKHRVAGAKG